MSEGGAYSMDFGWIEPHIHIGMLESLIHSNTLRWINLQHLGEKVLCQSSYDKKNQFSFHKPHPW